MIELSRLGRADFAILEEAARALEHWHHVIAREGGLLRLVLDHPDDAMEEWRHYPPGEVYDPASHAQFFYHRHAATAASRTVEEHGHFHTFMRLRGMPPGTRPLVMPELAIADAPSQPRDPISPPARQPNQGDGNDKFSHLIAVALDPAGTPTQLFTTNRWVTGETWYAAEDVIAMLDGFRLGLAGTGQPLHGWLAALLGLYRPDIAALLRARDAAIMSWRRRHRGKVHVFEDKRLEIASSLAIEPADRLDQLAALAGRVA